MDGIDDSDTGIIIEVKYDEKGNLESKCQRALRRIDIDSARASLYRDIFMKEKSYFPERLKE